MNKCVFLLISIFSLSVCAQDLEDLQVPDYKKNSVHISAGTLLVYAEANLNYEYIFRKTSIENVNVFLGGRFGLGVSYSNDAFISPNASFFLLTGEKNSHFELNAGGSMNLLTLNGKLPETNEFFSIYTSPILSGGYRFQKMTEGGLMLRAGIGYPMRLYAGLGWNF